MTRSQTRPAACLIIDKTTLAEVEQYGVARLLDELADELQEPKLAAAARAQGVDPQAGQQRIPAAGDRGGS